MSIETKQNARIALDSALFVAVMWGGAWTLGFVLGFG